MKKIFLILIIFSICFTVSCKTGSSKKSDNDADNNVLSDYDAGDADIFDDNNNSDDKDDVDFSDNDSIDDEQILDETVDDESEITKDSDLIETDEDILIDDEDIVLKIDDISGSWKKDGKINILKNDCGAFSVEDWDYNYNLIQKIDDSSFKYFSCSDEKCSEKGLKEYVFIFDKNSAKYESTSVTSAPGCDFYLTEIFTITFYSKTKAHYYWDFNLKTEGVKCSEFVDYSECDNQAEVNLSR